MGGSNPQSTSVHTHDMHSLGNDVTRWPNGHVWHQGLIKVKTFNLIGKYSQVTLQRAMPQSDYNRLFHENKAKQ